MPGAPFVDAQLHPVFRIDFAHDLPMSVDQLLHAIRLGQEAVPVFSCEIDGLAFSASAAIVVQSAAVHVVERPLTLLHQLGKEAAGPLLIGATCTGCYGF